MKTFILKWRPLISSYKMEQFEEEMHYIEYGEERRLFYVALTRAKKCTFVLYDKNNPSPFVSEFVEGARKETHDIPAEDRCPKCKCGQRLLLKKGKAVNGNPYFVYGCSNEVYGCDYRETKFVNLNRPVRRSSKRYN